MSAPMVAPEVAEAEFERFVEVMDLDVDSTDMDAEDRKSLDDSKRRFIRAVVCGSLVVNESGEPVFTPTVGDRAEITFYEPDGTALMAMDRAKKGHDVEKTNLVLAALTKQLPKRFAAMKNRDLKLCQAILCFYMGG